MSVLCVISTMMRPCLSVIAAMCALALYSSISEVAPPVMRQNCIDGTCGILLTGNSTR